MICYLQCETKPISGVVLSCGGYPINGAVSRVGAYLSIRIWKEPGKGKLLGVNLPVGSDEGSPRLSYPNGEISSSKQTGALALRGGNPYIRVGDSEWEKSHNGGFRLL